MKKNTIGVIHGRFQILHYGHLEYLLEGKKRCDYLYIGITNPDPNYTSKNKADLSRSLSSSNPLNYYQRMLMIEKVMIAEGISRDEFCIVPFPINFPESIKFYVPMDSTFFVTIYDQWGQHKLDTLKKHGAKTELMWIRDMSERFTTGKEVRELIRSDGKWERLVPKSVSSYLKQQNLLEIIKKTENENTNI